MAAVAAAEAAALGQRGVIGGGRQRVGSAMAAGMRSFAATHTPATPTARVTKAKPRTTRTTRMRKDNNKKTLTRMRTRREKDDCTTKRRTRMRRT